MEDREYFIVRYDDRAVRDNDLSELIDMLLINDKYKQLKLTEKYSSEITYRGKKVDVSWLYNHCEARKLKHKNQAVIDSLSYERVADVLGDCGEVVGGCYSQAVKQ